MNAGEEILQFQITIELLLRANEMWNSAKGSGSTSKVSDMYQELRPVALLTECPSEEESS